MFDGNSNMRQSDLKSALELCTLKEAILESMDSKDPKPLEETIPKLRSMVSGFRRT